MRKIVYTYSLLVACLLLFAACEKADPFQNNDQNSLSDIWLSIPGEKDARFNAAYSANKDTIYFDIPYFYPVNSDNDIDLSNLVLRANIPLDARITPALGTPMNLAETQQIEVVSGTGEARAYWVKVRKKADLTVKSVSVEVDGQTINGFERDGQLIFYVLPDLDVTQAKLFLEIDRHSTSSIAPGASVDLSQPVTLTITGVDGSTKQYTLLAVPPSKLPYGIGITRKLWIKSGAELGGFGAHTETSLSVSGDYVVVGTNTTPSRYRLINRFTGEVQGDMVMPNVPFRSFSMVSDDAGHIIGSSYTPKNSTFLVYKWDNALDDTPELLISYKNASNAPVDGAIGRRLSVYGDLSANAVIMATESRNPAILKWVVSGGQLLSETPEVIEYQDPVSGSWPYVADAQPVSASPNTNFFLNYSGEIALVDGNTGRRSSAFPNDPNLVGVYHMPADYFEFNNANYLGIVEYTSSNLGKARISIFDVTDPSFIGGASEKTRVFVSEEIAGSSNPNGTADIEVYVSPDGEKAWAYLLLTNGGVIAYELTNYDPQ